VFLVSPAVHRRIVLYTENRLKATMPLSPQEVRAQKDEEGRGQEAQSEKESIFDHGAAIGKKVDTRSAAMIKHA
ncbi:hypothetical protein, partial [Rhizobium leguminosarum]|uniref:hypothetical protein n=1 Tax=Rhizobium leguminosarum TaxID=384 RepID=UPI003F9C8478